MRLARTLFCSAVAVVSACHKDAPPASQSMTAKGPFEGTVVVRYEDPAKPAVDLTYEIKGHKLRVALPEATNAGKKGFVLFDTDTKKAVLVLDDRKVYVGIDLAAANVASAMLPTIDGSTRVEKAATTEVVAGYQCQDWAIATDTTKIDLCVAADVPWFAFGSASPSQSSALNELATGRNFPLRVITSDASGATKKKMEAKTITPGPIADDRFAPPPDYREVDMKEILTPAIMSAMPIHS